jgi:prepilin-type N-terminal cleavage/methylation domain-containing protein
MSDQWHVTGGRRAATRQANSGPGSRACRAEAFERRQVTRRVFAFTLIEMMIVMAIIGLIAAMGVPSILQIFRKEGMRRAVSDVQQLLADARARAIYTGRSTQVVFHPADKRLELADAPGGAPAAPLLDASANNSPSTLPPSAFSIPRGSVVLPDGVEIAMLDIDLLDFSGEETAGVCFYPNGTCQELTLVLHSGDAWQKITLEFSTALASAGPVTP